MLCVASKLFDRFKFHLIIQNLLLIRIVLVKFKLCILFLIDIVYIVLL